MRYLHKFSVLFLISVFSGLTFAEYALAQQDFVFGKNRVQYEAFDWRFIETEHFNIYYYDQKNYHLAQFTAESVESSLQQLMEDFNHTLTDRIDVIIYDSHSDFSMTNVVALPVDAQGIGGVTDKMQNRMTQPFMSDYRDFRRVLQHELLHAVVNDFYYGGGIQSMMRHNIQLRIPLWFEEGLAEYLAQGWDTETDMVMRDVVINNLLPPLYQISGILSYRGGQSFWNFIEEEYGRSKITEILQRLRQTRSVQQALVQSTGLSVQELSDRWKDSLQRRYFPEVAERQALTQVATRISERSRFMFNTSPAISPQGDRIAYISARRGVFDVVVVSAVTGEHLRTVIRGEDSPMFEELNILNPNLAWSPDGQQIALSTKSDGRYNLGVIDYESGDLQMYRFPQVDAINSVAWSPDGQKIAFDGNIGGYQSIFVYNLEREELMNLTKDVFTDVEPAWGPDSETVYFVSNRGNRLTAGQHRSGYSILRHEESYQQDIYSIRIGSNRIERLTNGAWDDYQPTLTNDGRMLFVSDRNGIPNIYEYNFDDRSARPLTDVRTGIYQISVSNDGSRLAFNAQFEGARHLYLMRNPFESSMDRTLTPNYWAERRASESLSDRVPAIGYAMEMINRRQQGNQVVIREPVTSPDPDALVHVDDITEEPAEAEEDATDEAIDFRNYVFGESVVRDTTLQLRDDPRKFQPVDNLTEDGRYQPKRYRLTFAPEITMAAGQINTFHGGQAFAMFTLSDLFGDHRLALGTNLVFDLRDSDYIIQYGYFRQRTNFVGSFFHQSRNFQTFQGQLLRFRTFGIGADFQYPFNRFERVDYGISLIGVNRDFSSIQGVGDLNLQQEASRFLLPQVTYTADYTLPGFITPRSGSRYSLRASGSPPSFLLDSPQFFTLHGDYRRYFDLGTDYAFAIRGAGAGSFGPDSQTFFMGGMLGWINQRWSDVEIPFDRLTDTFFAQPATPLRGHRFNESFGDRFALFNAEFRFPLFAAVIPGAVPILPLWNITGVAFVDAGAAWGMDINYSRYVDSRTGEPIVFRQKGGSLDFKIAQEKEVLLDPRTGLELEPGAGIQGEPANYLDGDILIGAGFGLRAIMLGLPFRYDIGWAYERDGFRSSPIHYFTIGIDF